MWSACERWLSTSEQCFTVLHQNDNQTSGVCCLDLLGCIAFVALALLCVQCITLIMTIIITVIMMDWIYMELFKAPKTLYIEPIIHSRHIRTGGGKLHPPLRSWSRLTEAWQPIKWPLRPPTNIHPHPYEAMWVKCFAQGHEDRPEWSGI